MLEITLRQMKNPAVRPTRKTVQDWERVVSHYLEWKPMDTAPRDGTQILGIYHNGVDWEYQHVRWTEDAQYPWEIVNSDSALSDDRLDYWTHLPMPPMPAP